MQLEPISCWTWAVVLQLQLYLLDEGHGAHLEQVRIELVAVPGHKEGMQLEPETEENCQFLGSLAQYNLSAAGPGLEWPAS